ncbi:MFS transporter [Saccharothrix algeriensis]|uniref:EmrB/QacA subfamily drug resistance transporter n=2 Tax=Saccharothrix algeriensis TaxID=173560 RepID=A0ABS2S2B9_9PSEU|nr:MFS transporter [Saccharothrix algeriensis]MBM7810387.1 EmrB/QacA subfamily drug resistance transporter [Saccharothrix algeriensis]
MTAQSDAPPQSHAVREPRRWFALAVLVVAQLTVWLDNTILNVAISTLADPVRGVGASPSELQWSISSYTLVFAALLFTGGVLGDRQGYRRVLLLGMLVFGASSAWAAYAGSAGELIAARAVMGVGSALVMPATLAIINQVFDGKERATAIAVWSGSSGLAIAAGPLVSGALLEHFWWGSIFLVNLPFVVVGTVGALAFIADRRATTRPKFDPLGVALSTAGLVALVYGVIEGGHQGTWVALEVLGPLVLGALLLVAFVVVELRISAPSFDVRLFRNSWFTGGSVSVMLTFFGLTGTMYYSNLYLQGTRGLSPLECGLALAPVAAGVVVGAPVSAVLVRKLGIRAVVSVAMLVAVATFYAYVWFDLDTPLGWFTVLMVVQGLALGAVMAPTTEAIMASLPPESSGAGSAVNNAMRQLGGVLGVAVLGSVLSMTYSDDVAGKLPPLPEGARAAAEESAEGARVVAGQAGLPQLVDVANTSFIHSMHVTTVVGAAVSLLGVVVAVIFFRRRRDPA